MGKQPPSIPRCCSLKANYPTGLWCHSLHLASDELYQNRKRDLRPSEHHGCTCFSGVDLIGSRFSAGQWSRVLREGPLKSNGPEPTVLRPRVSEILHTWYQQNHKAQTNLKSTNYEGGRDQALAPSHAPPHRPCHSVGDPRPRPRLLPVSSMSLN